MVVEVAPSASAWEVARDASQVHDLLIACDAYQAARSGTPQPTRRARRTEELVVVGAVWLLRAGGEAVGSFTLTWHHPGVDTQYPPARRPVYLSRLCVAPKAIRSVQLIGAQCVRKAVELATEGGADALRAEANPDITDTFTLLRELGFQQHGPDESDGLRRWVYLSKPLPGTPRGGRS